MPGKDDYAVLWIGGLPYDITEAQLRDTFGRFGKISDVRIKQKPALNGASAPPFAFLQFDRQREANEAAKEMDQAMIWGSAIKCQAEKSQEKKQWDTWWGGSGGWSGGQSGGQSGQSGQTYGRRSRSPRRRSRSAPRRGRTNRSRSVRGKSRSVPARGNRKSRSPPARGKKSRSARGNRKSGSTRSTRDRTRSRDKKDRKKTQSRERKDDAVYTLSVERIPGDMNWEELKELARAYAKEHVLFSKTYEVVEQVEGEVAEEGASENVKEELLDGEQEPETKPPPTRETREINCGELEFNDKIMMEKVLKKLNGRKIKGHPMKLIAYEGTRKNTT